MHLVDSSVIGGVIACAGGVIAGAGFALLLHPDAPSSLVFVVVDSIWFPLLAGIIASIAFATGKPLKSRLIWSGIRHLFGQGLHTSRLLLWISLSRSSLKVTWFGQRLHTSRLSLWISLPNSSLKVTQCHLADSDFFIMTQPTRLRRSNASCSHTLETCWQTTFGIKIVFITRWEWNPHFNSPLVALKEEKRTWHACSDHRFRFLKTALESRMIFSGVLHSFGQGLYSSGLLLWISVSRLSLIVTVYHSLIFYCGEIPHLVKNHMVFFNAPTMDLKIPFVIERNLFAAH